MLPTPEQNPLEDDWYWCLEMSEKYRSSQCYWCGGFVLQCLCTNEFTLEEKEAIRNI